MQEYPSTFDMLNSSYNPISLACLLSFCAFCFCLSPRGHDSPFCVLGASLIGLAELSNIYNLCVLHLQALQQIAYTHDQMYRTIACYEPPKDELTVWVSEYKCAPISPLNWFLSLVYVIKYILAVTHFKSTAGSEIIFTTFAFTVFDTIKICFFKCWTACRRLCQLDGAKHLAQSTIHYTLCKGASWKSKNHWWIFWLYNWISSFFFSQHIN